MRLEREIKVGLLVFAALLVLAGGLFLIGSEEQLFVRTNRYSIHFNDVDGLAAGGVVELSGVAVGKVEKIVLPDNPGRSDVVVWVEIDRRHAGRLRAPARGSAPPQPPGTAPGIPPPTATTAELKTQGLLGDKYVALTVGAQQYPPIAAEGEIPVKAPLNVDSLIASSGNAMGEVNRILADLRTFSSSLNAQGGLIPRLVTDKAYGAETAAALHTTLANLAQITAKVAHGQGTLGKLVDDPSVYTGLRNVVAGVNNNGVLRWLVRNREKAGSAAHPEKPVAKNSGSHQQPPPSPRGGTAGSAPPS
jgi:phospholipid/cholesterol/gamma-HCH transport system substrate-binding protein